MYVTFIGDIHGCYLTLMGLLEKIPKEQNRIIFLGDLINKGPRSYEVYAFVRNNGYEMVVGNHEFLCVNRHQSAMGQLWLRQGGWETTLSVRKHTGSTDDRQVQTVLSQMAWFFEQQPAFLEIPTASGVLLATHAGISRKLFRQNNYRHELCLRVDSRLPDSPLFNKKPLAQIPGYIQVIGHQPTEMAPKEVEGNYLLDSGCVYDKRGMGYLSALMFSLNKRTPPIIFRHYNID